MDEVKIHQMHRETGVVRKPGQKTGFIFFLRASSFLLYQGTKKASSRLERCQSMTEFMLMEAKNTGNYLSATPPFEKVIALP
jgi:hypothetical protein